MNKFFTSLFFLLLLPAFISAQNTYWATSFGGYATDTGNTSIKTITKDMNGNIWVAGSWGGWANFDPEKNKLTTKHESAEYTSKGGGKDAFLSKFDGAGNFKDYGVITEMSSSSRTGDQVISKIVAAKSSPYIYACGYFNGEHIDFDLSASGTAGNLTSNNSGLNTYQDGL